MIKILGRGNGGKYPPKGRLIFGPGKHTSLAYRRKVRRMMKALKEGKKNALKSKAVYRNPQ